MNPATSEPTSRGDVEGVVQRGLAACDALMARHLDAVQRRFGAHGLGVIDLPDLGETALVPAQIGVGATLYWCREIEATGLVPLVEVLAHGLAQGNLGIPLEGAALERLYGLWRHREERLVATERAALFKRVFGGGSEVMQGFDTWMALLVRALVSLGRRENDRGIADLQARIGVLMTDVARHLSERGVGIAGFAAREMLQQVREALEILRDPNLARSLGGGGPWMLVTRMAPSLLGNAVDVPRHIDRARGGLVILQWVADHANDLRQAAMGIERNSPLVGAAERMFAWEGPA